MWSPVMPVQLSYQYKPGFLASKIDGEYLVDLYKYTDPAWAASGSNYWLGLSR